MSKPREVNGQLGLNRKQGNDFVTLEQYGLLPQSRVQQKLTPLDMVMPRLYGTRWILCFPLDAGINKARVYEVLRVGLAHTISSIPWIAGNIAPPEGCDPGDNRIEIADPGNGVKFLYKDLSGILPSYAELKTKHFPLSRLSTAQLSPLGLMPERIQPVMAAQANFIEGGLLLTIGIHHSACDAQGFDSIIEIWSRNTAAANDSGPFSVYDPMSNDRSPLMVGAPGASLADFPEYVLLPTPKQATADATTHQMATTPFQLPPMTAHIFYFSPESLTDIKTAARAYSTNDALCAFVWRHVTLARNPSGASGCPDGGETISALLYAVNIRSRTSPPLPPSYMGNASMATITDRLTVSALTTASGIVRAAAAIRKSLNTFSTPTRVPSTIGLLDSRPDPTDFKFAYNGFLGPDISATSWADVQANRYEWGVLGKADSLRMPGEGSDGAMNIFPRLADGGLEVMVSLELGAMKRLLEDEQFLLAAKLWG